MKLTDVTDIAPARPGRRALPIAIRRDGSQSLYSIAARPTLNQGDDPILGAEHPPVFYQLFVRSTQPRLYWTVPDVSFIYNYAGFFPLAPGPAPTATYTWWYSPINAPSTALSKIQFGGFVASGPYYWWILENPNPWPTNNPGPRPVGSGTLEPEGFKGAVGFSGTPLSGFTPVFTPWTDIWDGSITGFDVSRWSKPDASDAAVIATGLAGNIRDYTDAIAVNPVYYYGLLGHTTIFDFYYNTVYYAKSQPLSGVPDGNGIRLNWTAPVFP